MEADTITVLQFAGSVDRIDAQAVEGWVTVQTQASSKLPLEIMLDGQVIGRCTADRFRQDLADAGLGEGSCAFSFPMPAFVPTASLPDIKIRVSGSPLYLENPKKAASSGTEIARPTVSRFGGLWVDRYDFIDRVGQKHRHGQITDEMSEQLVRFTRDGYIVLQRAVSSDVLKRLNAEIDRIWQKPPQGVMIETFEPDGVMRYIPPDIAWRNGTTKLLDLYVASKVAREAISAPKAVAFLNALFEGPPKAFQSLNFWNGSQQNIHKDTAYVKIDSNPMALAASWLALEDISAGTGELEYYIGSHRAPDFLFGGVSKWMESHADEHPKFLASLHQDAQTFDQVKGKFLANAGDVLIWHADLAHGGSKIEQPEKTRKSLVTHFCPAAEEPFYRRAAHYAGAQFGGTEFVSQYGDVN